ncbi:MAG: hypothetical protein ABWJ42_03365 [Sulfolobales archaeon]
MKRSRLLDILIVVVIVIVIAVAYTKFTTPQESSSPTTTASYLPPDTPPNKIPNGVYVWDWDKKLFVRVNSSKSYYLPDRDGYYLYYFHNNQCPHCQYFESKLQPYLRTLSDDSDLKNKLSVVLVVCNWFTLDCGDPLARNTFSAFNIQASPTFILIEITNGSVSKMIDISELYVRVFPTAREFEPQYVFQLVRVNIE